jgi:hypothetical protein
MAPHNTLPRHRPAQPFLASTGTRFSATCQFYIFIEKMFYIQTMNIEHLFINDLTTVFIISCEKRLDNTGARSLSNNQYNKREVL